MVNDREEWGEIEKDWGTNREFELNRQNRVKRLRELGR